jgi:asparagine synthase (glutamine-hydrolysing)
LSAIYGFFECNGAPVSGATLDCMEGTFRYWGPDGGGQWLADGIGLGQLVLNTTAEARSETGPHHLAGGEVMVAAGRLDNREELGRELNLARPAALSETAIIAAAFQRWGRLAPARLYGDWAFACWDPDKRELFIARDHFGNSALYYNATAKHFAFASSRKALLALSQVPRRLNELRLAQHLAPWITDGAATFHDGIFRLPPGHTLTASSTGINVCRYWHPEDLAELRLSSDQAYLEQFLELYAAAVRTRMRSNGPIATTLSSGLDSGSITALAAQEARISGQSLIALTSRPRFPEIERTMPGVLVDEWPLAKTVAAHCGNLEHHAISGDAITPLQAMRRSLELHDEPEFAVGNLTWIQDLFSAVQLQGARVLLIGQMGNAGVSWTGEPYYIFRLALTAKLTKLVQALHEWKGANRSSWPSAVWHHLAKPSLVATEAFAFRRGWRSLPVWGQALYNPHFLDRLQIVARMRAGGYDPFFSPGMKPGSHRIRMLMPDINPVGALFHESGAGYGLDVRDPTADVRLLEYCLRVPDEQYQRRGQNRLLMRRAMQALLPPGILWNPRRGLQGADFALRLYADRLEIDEAMDSIADSALVREYLDVKKLRSLWNAIRERPVEVPLHHAFAFGRFLQYGLFLEEGL